MLKFICKVYEFYYPWFATRGWWISVSNAMKKETSKVFTAHLANVSIMITFSCHSFDKYMSLYERFISPPPVLPPPPPPPTEPPPNEPLPQLLPPELFGGVALR